MFDLWSHVEETLGTLHDVQSVLQTVSFTKWMFTVVSNLDVDNGISVDKFRRAISCVSARLFQESQGKEESRWWCDLALH